VASDAVRDGARLAALRDTALLDSDPDETFTRLNRLAVELLGVPVSLVSLVGEDRQVFAGQAGLPEPWASYRETPLSHLFSEHVVDRDEPLVIEDARTHPLVSGNPVVRDLGFRRHPRAQRRSPTRTSAASSTAAPGLPPAAGPLRAIEIHEVPPPPTGMTT
jgi:hypothetical protein